MRIYTINDTLRQSLNKYWNFLNDELDIKHDLIIQLTVLYFYFHFTLILLLRKSEGSSHDFQVLAYFNLYAV